jgi:hypothetical protein
MNCSECERIIASEAPAAGVDEHLRGCAVCRAFAEDIEANRAALAPLTVHQAALDAVRARVLDRIESQRRRSRRWMWPFALASAAMLWTIIFLPRFRNPAPPQPIEFAKTPKLIAYTPRPVVRPASQQRRPESASAKREPLVVKMLTNDPDVIVVWLVDQGGDAP